MYRNNRISNIYFKQESSSLALCPSLCQCTHSTSIDHFVLQFVSAVKHFNDDHYTNTSVCIRAEIVIKM